MARKKNHPAAAHHQEDILKPVDTPIDLAAAAEDKIGNLKTLNGLLLKETKERRDQVNHLNSLLDDGSFLSAFERDVARLVLSSRLTDLEHRAADAKGALQVKLDLAISERDRSRADIELKAREVGELEDRVREAEAGREVLERDVDALMAGRAADAAKISSLEGELERVGSVVEETEARRGVLEREIEGLVRSKKEEVDELMAWRAADAAKISALVAQVEDYESKVKEDAAKISAFVAQVEDYESKVKEVGNARDVLGKEIEGIVRKNKEEVDSLTALSEADAAHISALVSEVEGYESKVKEMETALDYSEKKMKMLVMRNKEEVDTLIAKRDMDAAKISGLEEELRKISIANEGLEVELSSSRDVVVSLKKEKEALRLEFAELEEKTAKVLEVLESVRADFGALKKDREETEKSFRSQLKESADELHDLSTKLGETTAEKDEIERARAKLEIEIAGMEKEVQQLQSQVSQLEGVCKDHAEANSLLRADKDAGHSDLNAERENVQVLRLRVAELENSKVWVESELEKLRLVFGKLQEEKEEEEKKFELQIRESSQQVDDLSRAIGEIARQKDDVERARSNLELEITGLKSKMEQFRHTVSQLEEASKGQSAVNAQLKAERDRAQKDLDAEIAEAGRLRARVGELEKSKDGIMEELRQLKAGHDRLTTKHEETKMHLVSSAEDKALLEKSLDAVQGELQDTKKEMDSAKVISEKTLTLLRNASKAMLAVEEDQENCLTREITDESDMGVELSPFAAELEAIKTALVYREGKIKELSREVAMAEAQKKNRGFFTWVVPAATTVSAALAAGFAAYAAKGR